MRLSPGSPGSCARMVGLDRGSADHGRAVRCAIMPLDIPDKAWAKAVRREAAVRPLAAVKNSRAIVAAAARALGLSTVPLHRLMQAYRAQPVTQSLVVDTRSAVLPGPVA